MEKKKLAEVIKGVIQKRIDLLAGILAKETDDPVAALAAIQLANIGTKEASDALMDLIEQCGETFVQDMMIIALLFHSPFRNDYKERLMQVSGDPQDIEEAYADVTASLSDLSGQPPLWQEVAEALKAELTDEKHGPVLLQG